MLEVFNKQPSFSGGGGMRNSVWRLALLRKSSNSLPPGSHSYTSELCFLSNMSRRYLTLENEKLLSGWALQLLSLGKFQLWQEIELIVLYNYDYVTIYFFFPSGTQSQDFILHVEILF